MDKDKGLKKLKKKIDSLEDPFIFEPHGQVRGFWGTKRIMIVGERPTLNRKTYPPPALNKLFEVLITCKLHESHLTDLIKTRSKVKAKYPFDLSPHRKIFDKEIEIIKPKLIIALGQKVYDLLIFAIADKKILIQKVTHYSYRFGKPNRLLKEFRKILSENITK